MPLSPLFRRRNQNCLKRKLGLLQSQFDFATEEFAPGMLQSCELARNRAQGLTRFEVRSAESLLHQESRPVLSSHTVLGTRVRLEPRGVLHVLIFHSGLE